MYGFVWSRTAGGPVCVLAVDVRVCFGSGRGRLAEAPRFSISAASRQKWKTSAPPLTYPSIRVSSTHFLDLPNLT